MAVDPLDELRGLHMPAMDLNAVVGEVCAALAVGLFGAFLIAGLIRLVTAQRVPAETIALRKFDAVDGEASDGDALAMRAAILQDYAEGIEGDGDWLSRLDARMSGLFSDGAGKGLREALYRPGAKFDLSRFDDEVRIALRQVAK